MFCFFIIFSALSIMIFTTTQPVIEEPEPIKITAEQQKDKCDSLYLEYISDYTAYQSACMYNESEKLINLLQQRYQSDSIKLMEETNKYFKLIKHDSTR